MGTYGGGGECIFIKNHFGRNFLSKILEVFAGTDLNIRTMLGTLRQWSSGAVRKNLTVLILTGIVDFFTVADLALCSAFVTSAGSTGMLWL